MFTAAIWNLNGDLSTVQCIHLTSHTSLWYRPVLPMVRFLNNLSVPLLTVSVLLLTNFPYTCAIMKLEASDEAKVGVIQIHNETLSRRQIRDITNSIRDQSLTVLSLRECRASDVDFRRLVRAVAVSRTLRLLNFNAGLVNSEERVDLLAQCLKKNKSLKSLFLQGTDLSEDTLSVLTETIVRHPSLISLDIGDCDIDDGAIEDLVPLLSPHKAFQGLVELGLSGNRDVTEAAWCRLFQAMALAAAEQRCRLAVLYMDYCLLGDGPVTCLATALAAMTSLRVLDLESTGLTNRGAQFLLYLVSQQQPETRLTTINLTGNNIDTALEQAIQNRLSSKATPSTSESETESDVNHSTIRSYRITDPEKLAALENLTKILQSYTKLLLARELGEDVPDTTAESTAEKVESKADFSALYVDDVDEENDRDVLTSPSEDDDDETDTDVEGEVLLQERAVQDQTTMEDSGFSEEDEGEFLQEIPHIPVYSVVLPVTYKSKVSAGYFF